MHVLVALMLSAAPAQAAGDGEESRVEKFQQSVSAKILDRANQLDSLFGDDRIDDEAQQSRLRVYTDINYDEEGGTGLGAKVKLRLVLPNTKDRLRLDFNGEDDEDALDEADEEQESENDRSVGLNFSARESRRTKTDLGLGLRYRDSSLIVYEKARHRVYFEGDKWLPRLTNEVRHYGDTGWQYLGQMDFDRAFSDRWFMRSRSQIKWYENDETDEDKLRCNDGWCVNQFFSLYQKLDDPKHAIAYDWLNYFVTKPDNQLDELQLRVRYRRQLKWDWLHFEVRPRLRFIEEEDYNARWSVLFRLEGIFGYVPQTAERFNAIESIQKSTEGRNQTQQ